MRKTCRNVFTASTTAVFLSANMFSFPTLDNLKIVDGNLLACQAIYAVCLRIFKQNNLLWPLAFLHQYRLQASKRLKAAAFNIFPTIIITFFIFLFSVKLLFEQSLFRYS